MTLGANNKSQGQMLSQLPLPRMIFTFVWPWPRTNFFQNEVSSSCYWYLPTQSLKMISWKLRTPDCQQTNRQTGGTITKLCGVDLPSLIVFYVIVQTDIKKLVSEGEKDIAWSQRIYWCTRSKPKLASLNLKIQKTSVVSQVLSSKILKTKKTKKTLMDICRSDMKSKHMCYDRWTLVAYTYIQKSFYPKCWL